MGGVRPPRRASRARPLADLATLLRVAVAYWLAIRPQVRRELARWDRLAQAIPDPLLRAQALAKLDGERLNPEAAALFAVLAPLRRRRRVVRLIVAYQVLYDYLDGVNEQPGYDGLAEGLQLHEALTEALLPGCPERNYYPGHVGAEDGGYVCELSAVCQEAVAALHSSHRFTATIRRATERCGQAQSYNHASRGRRTALAEWSRTQTRDQRYEWWELAAGAISCLNIHALLACAADPSATVSELAHVERAYFPSICSISALLDSLSDYHTDLATGNHSFVAHYADGPSAALRLEAIAAEARSLTAALSRPARHHVILAGIVAYYLSCPSVDEGFPAEAAKDLASSLGGLGPAMLTVLRLRRRARAREQRTSRLRRGQLDSRRARPGWTREAATPGPASRASAAPRIASTAINTSAGETENSVGNPVTSRR
jgi:tetraprenyl-beta-curcumene synthase